MINVYYRNLIQYRLVLESESNSIELKQNPRERRNYLERKRYELFGYAAAEELYAGGAIFIKHETEDYHKYFQNKKKI